MNTIIHKEIIRPAKKRLLNKDIREKVLEYYNSLLIRELPKKYKSGSKIANINFVIPDINESHLLLDYSYSTDQLKKICKYYKQKLTGNKCQLVVRLYNYLNLTNIIIKIQKLWFGFIRRKFNKYHGPAFFKRNLCVNDTDFYSFEKLIDTPADQFFSFQDEDKFIFGFDILSIYNLFIKNGSNTENPYNKKKMDPEIFNNIKIFIKLSKLLKVNTDLTIKESEDNLQTNISVRILSLFQYMDSLGNYTDIRWFNELNSQRLIIFIKELYDIWTYRAQLDLNIKRLICPPFGDPFRNINFSTLTSHTYSNIQKIILSIMEKLVLSAINTDNKTLGAYYVLSALTLVSEEAALAMPWLYESIV